MKKHIATLCLAFALCSVFWSAKAQPFNDEKYMFVKRDISDDIIAQLKNTKTVFLYNNLSQKQVDTLKSVLLSVWDLTPLVFDDVSNTDKYLENPKYSYINLEPQFYNGLYNNGYSESYSYIALRLFNGLEKTGVGNTVGLGRIELYPDLNTRLLVLNEFFHKGFMQKLYDKGVFYNYSYILLKAQIGALCSNLKQHKRIGVLENFKINNLSELLTNDTLYIPENYVDTYFARWGRTMKKRKENIMEKYKYPYRACSNEELFDIFQKQNRGRFLFEFVSSGKTKIISVYDLKNKTISFREATRNAYELEKSDFEKF